MPESGPDVQALDVRLSEIDRRLRDIQAELLPSSPAVAAPEAPADNEPSSPPEPPPAPEPPPVERPAGVSGRSGPLADVLGRIPRQPRIAGDHLLRRIEQLTEVQSEVVASLRELVEGFDHALAQLTREGGELIISARPFDTLEQLRQFERDLAALPGVASATVRGYEGRDGAQIEVRLAHVGGSGPH